MAEPKMDNQFLEWIRGNTPRSNNVIATCDIPPHTIVLVDSPVACSPSLDLCEGHPGRRAFPIDVNFPNREEGKIYMPIAELVEGLRRTGWDDNSVGGDLGLLPRNHAPKNATPLIRAAMANSFEMRCIFTSVVIGEAVYGLASAIRHSCRPNAVYAFGVCGDIVVATGSETVHKGDTLTVSRIGAAYGNTRCTCNRRGLVIRKIGHVCMCDMCTEADAENNSTNSGSHCPDDKCLGALRETSTKEVFAVALKPYNGLSDPNKDFAEIADLWSEHRGEIIATPTFLDLLSRKATMFAPHTHDKLEDRMDVMNEMACAIEGMVIALAVTPEFMRFTNYCHFARGYSNDLNMISTVRSMAMDWIRAILKRFPWIESNLHDFSLGTTAINAGLPMHLRAIWATRALSEEDYRNGMARGMSGDIGNVTRLQEMPHNQLLDMAGVLGVDPMKYAGAATPEDREDFIAAISEEIQEREKENGKDE